MAGERIRPTHRLPRSTGFDVAASAALVAVVTGPAYARLGFLGLAFAIVGGVGFVRLQLPG